VFSNSLDLQNNLRKNSLNKSPQDNFKFAYCKWETSICGSKENKRIEFYNQMNLAVINRFYSRRANNNEVK